MPLLKGVVHRRTRPEPVGARLLAPARRRSAPEPPERDRRWARLAAPAMLCAELGENGEAESTRTGDRAEARSSWRPTRSTRAHDGADAGSQAARRRGQGRPHHRRDRSGQQGLAHAERALIAARRRDREGARSHTDQAVRLLRQAASSRALAECWRLVGITALHAGNEKQAEDALSRGLRLYKIRGNLIGQAECLAGLGRAATRRRDRELAEERLRQAIHLYEVAGNSDVVKPKRNRPVRVGTVGKRSARLLANLGCNCSAGRLGAIEGLGAMQARGLGGCLPVGFEPGSVSPDGS